jgi:capsular polysaccharide biosynthesis protein
VSRADQRIDAGGGKTLFVVEDATATPALANPADRTFTGCVFDRRGQLVKAGQRTGRRTYWKPADPEQIDPAQSAGVVPGHSIYLGHYSTHYGHFLLETLSRFWALDHGGPYDRVVFHPFTPPGSLQVPFVPADICFACFGVERERVLLVDRPLRFEQLVVPTSLVEINHDADADQIAIYRRIANFCAERYAESEPSPRLYLSRSRLNGFRPIANEEEVEALFASLGFAIIYPEQHHYGCQVASYRGAQILAGVTGSALHNTVFAPEGSLAINIGNPRHPHDTNRNQKMCDRLARVRTEFIPFEGTAESDQSSSGRLDLRYLRREVERLLGAEAA